MKMTILVLLLTYFTISVDAQTNNSLVFGNALVKYKNMERIGTGLTIIGGAALFTGNILYWKTYNKGSKENTEDKARTYGTVMFAGLGVMAVGIPLWAIGKTKERHITIEAGLVKYRGLASANGIAITVNF
jgi:hypothetical protein